MGFSHNTTGQYCTRAFSYYCSVQKKFEFSFTIAQFSEASLFTAVLIFRM